MPDRIQQLRAPAQGSPEAVRSGEPREAYAPGLPVFDEGFPADERLPDQFEMRITQRPSGESALEWNGVFIGDPLTDNIRDPDGFRFHDVIHLAYVAVLHWSPTIRALIQHQRRSDSAVLEAQDGRRAVAIDEGLTAWLFGRARRLRFFEGQTRVPRHLLETVQQFVEGYEVEACPPELWEDAILQGFSAFREIQAREGGIVYGDRSTRRITFKPLRES